MTYAIEIESLRKVYRKRNSPDVVAVDNLNLTVAAGQVFGFLGSNGAGKTTTIKMACGLVQPTSGHVRLNGFDAHRQRGDAMRQIGAVLEGTRNVYWRLTAWQNLLYFGRLKGVTGRALEDRAKRLLTELDLWDRRNDSVNGFSRGMQQKVAIACALVADPPIVLLDEPTLGLDVQAARTVKRWIETLVKEEGKTVVLTTHQLDMAESLCDQVAIISHGKLLAHQPTTELLSLFRQEFYRVRVNGHLEAAQIARFPHLTPIVENGQTILSGPIAAHADLYALIDQLRALDLELVSVSPTEPNLEEIFVEMMDRANGVGK
jgi:ABC-2 type transport system ATP-binding protein